MTYEEEQARSAAAMKANDERNARAFAKDRIKAFELSDRTWNEECERYAANRGHVLHMEWMEAMKQKHIADARDEFEAKQAKPTLERHLAGYHEGQRIRNGHGKSTTEQERATLAALVKSSVELCERIKNERDPEEEERLRQVAKYDMGAGFNPNSHV